MMTFAFLAIISGTVGYFAVAGTVASWLPTFPDEFSPFAASVLAMLVGIAIVLILGIGVLGGAQLVSRMKSRKAPLTTET